MRSHFLELGTFSTIDRTADVEALTRVVDGSARGFCIINVTTDEILIRVTTPASLEGEELTHWIEGYKGNLLDHVWPNNVERPELAHVEFDADEARALVEGILAHEDTHE